MSALSEATTCRCSDSAAHSPRCRIPAPTELPPGWRSNSTVGDLIQKNRADCIGPRKLRSNFEVNDLIVHPFTTPSGLNRATRAAGIQVRPRSVKLLSEEAPYAYKDVDEVADVCERAGLAARVARLRPLGVVKG